MKLAQLKRSDGIHLALWREGRLIDLTTTARKFRLPLPRNMREAIQDAALIERIAGAGDMLVEVPLAGARFAPAVTPCPKLLCVGLNYRAHADECGLGRPEAPVLFAKLQNALSAHGQPIPMPPASVQLDYEAELVIVVGRRMKCVPPERALSHVFGYTCGNDVSARDLQSRSSQWLIGKSQDGFAPVGPWVVTADELNPDNLDIGTRVNGRWRQRANTSDMIFGCAEILSYASTMMTLEPGDLVFTGTPSGVIVGLPEKDREWLRPGDRVEIEIEGIGTLENIVAPTDA
ncbi:MAG: fumarylacetoacetate hydrolase family protein [Clostridiales bacterium]|nr:fumarylacetoacetate hydrolase family protein [Clostridiales bacterium]